jgi:hypothetical protein
MQMTTQSGQLWNTKQTAAYLGVSAGTLRVWRSTKRYPLKYRKIGSAVRYDSEEVKSFDQQRLMTPIQDKKAR